MNYLAIKVPENLDGDVLKLLVHRSDDCFDSLLYGLNTWLERPSSFLGEVIEHGEAHKGLNGSHMYEFQVLQPFLLFLVHLLKDSMTKSPIS